MRHAVNIPPFTAATTVLDLMLAADGAGWDGVYLWDHLVWDGDHDVHDPWTLLGAAASRTERVVLGPCVTPLARRRPQVVAKHLTTLDDLSDGRAILGVGLGEPADGDFAAFGDDPDPRTRARRLDESLAVLDPMLRGERADHDGEHHAIHAELRPATAQRPRPPIFVAGVAPHRRPIARALRWDGYFPISPDGPMAPDRLAEYLDGVDRPDGWDLLVAPTGEHGVADYEAVGVTWMVDGTRPVGDWVTELRERIVAGPPT